MRNIAAVLALIFICFAGMPASAVQFVQSHATMSKLLSEGFKIMSTTLAPHPNDPDHNTLLFALQRNDEAYLCRYKILQADPPFGFNYCYRLKE